MSVDAGTTLALNLLRDWSQAHCVKRITIPISRLVQMCQHMLVSFLSWPSILGCLWLLLCSLNEWIKHNSLDGLQWFEFPPRTFKGLRQNPWRDPVSLTITWTSHIQNPLEPQDSCPSWRVEEYLLSSICGAPSLEHSSLGLVLMSAHLREELQEGSTQIQM